MRRSGIVILLIVLIGCHGTGRSAGIKTPARTRVEPAAEAPWHARIQRLNAEEIELQYQVLAAGNPTEFADHDRFTGPLTRMRSFDLLLNAVVFRTAFVGIGGTPSTAAQAFHVLLDQPDAAAVFSDLLRRGSLAGQMYALNGLYVVDRPAFTKAYGEFQSDKRSLAVQLGCLTYDVPVAEVVADSRAGTWLDRELKGLLPVADQP